MKKIAFMFAVAAMFVACGPLRRLLQIQSLRLTLLLLTLLLLTALPLIQLLLLSNLAN